MYPSVHNVPSGTLFVKISFFESVMDIKPTTERGRPRGFDADRALEQALHLFWRKGFDATSMSELTNAMGINKPSLYAAFGDKETLYLRAMERYAAQRLQHPFSLLGGEPDVRLAVDAFLRALAKMYTQTELPDGCFLINGSADLGNAALPDSVEAGLKAMLKGGEATIKVRLERGKREGQFPAAMEPSHQAAFLMSVVAGLAVLAKSGAGLAKLNRVIDVAMAGWTN